MWSVKCKVRSVKCEVWSVKEAVRSEKCEVWTVKCAILLSFAAGLRKSHWSGCIKGATVISSSAGNYNESLIDDI